MGRGFLWEIPLHLAKKDARPWLCLSKVPPTMELAKIKAGISRIDTVVGKENWEIRIEGLHREFKGSYPTHMVVFKVQNHLIVKNISNQNFTIDGKQFKIREYLESTSFRCIRCQELGSHLSKDCSNPKKCVRCAGPYCDIRNCKKGTLLCSNCGGGHSAAHKFCPALKAKKTNLFQQKQQKYHAGTGARCNTTAGYMTILTITFTTNATFAAAALQPLNCSGINLQVNKPQKIVNFKLKQISTTNHLLSDKEPCGWPMRSFLIFFFLYRESQKSFTE